MYPEIWRCGRLSLENVSSPLDDAHPSHSHLHLPNEMWSCFQIAGYMTLLSLPQIKIEF
jgi:hypothetical protein